jgi:hypothetical protein
MNKLSVGRIVHYFPDDDSSNPLAAIVTRVFGETSCSLAVFDDARGRITGGVPVTVNQRDASNRTRVWDWPARV